ERRREFSRIAQAAGGGEVAEVSSEWGVWSVEWGIRSAECGIWSGGVMDLWIAGIGRDLMEILRIG
ncbi:MAG: hypothetical protein ACE5IR_23825, partial [bacterium]